VQAEKNRNQKNQKTARTEMHLKSEQWLSVRHTEQVPSL